VLESDRKGEFGVEKTPKPKEMFEKESKKNICAVKQ
jgi:hypothetical protein